VRHSSGIDVAWDWASGSHWRLDLIGTWYLQRETAVAPEEPSSTVDCAGVVNFECFPTPDWRHIATAAYDSNSWWAITGRWRFYSEVEYTGTLDQIANDQLEIENYFDLSAVVHFMSSHSLTIGVNNILDEEPPLAGATLLPGNANALANYDQLGRYLFANVTLRW
jgi:outer membrane receptor protein involved in Fe transport